MWDYLTCPGHFIASAIWDWYESWRYQRRFPHTAPAYYERNPRFIAFEEYFVAKFVVFAKMRYEVGSINQQAYLELIGRVM